MTAPVFAPHTGCHRPPPGPVALFFRRLRLRRKPAAPEAPSSLTSGAATALLGDPVLGDDMIADVRQRWNEWHDGTLSPEAAASVVLANRNAEALGFGFRMSLTPQEHADLMHAGYANAVDRLRREAGLPPAEELQAMQAAAPASLFPPLEPPPWAAAGRGPLHDTRLDLGAPHYAPDVAPVFGQAAQLEVEPELARRVIA